MEYNEGLGSIRTKKEPKKTGIGYKVFYQKDGKLYPPMVANPGGVDTPIGVWLDADAAPIVGNSKTGRPQVKNGGKGTQGGSGTLAYRPGWHLGLIPYAIQFNRKDENGEKTLFPKDFVWAEVEYADDKNYQKEAEAEGYTENGKYRHSYAGLKHLPTDGYYIYRTNPNPDTDPWIITGAMKVNRILTDKEVDDLVRKAGREPQRREQESISSVLSGLGMSVHHNSPYLLKRADGSFIDPESGERLGFDHRFMSKGEGAQVHGWGSYFSVEDLKHYGNNGKLKVFYKGVELNLDIDDFKKKFPNYIEYANVYSIFRRMEEGKSAYDAIEILKNYYNEEIKYHPKGALEHLKFIETLNPSDFKMGRHHYHVEIPDNDGTNYIEEDKKLSKKVLNKVVKEFERMGWKFSNTKGGIYLDSPKGDDTLAINPLDKGGDLYWKISSLNNFTPEKASKLLHDAGFVGIHYFGRQDGECYVIFDENDAKIVGHDLFGVEIRNTRKKDDKKEDCCVRMIQLQFQSAIAKLKLIQLKGVNGIDDDCIKRIENLHKASTTINKWIKQNKNGKFKIELPSFVEKKIENTIGRHVDVHKIDSKGIRHSIKNHGKKGRKVGKQDIPILDEYYMLIPYIMVAPDRIEKGSDDLSMESVKFIKKLSNGDLIVVEKESINNPDVFETINMWGKLSDVVNAKSPNIHVRNVLISTSDVAKIIKDAELSIIKDKKSGQPRLQGF